MNKKIIIALSLTVILAGCSEKTVKEDSNINQSVVTSERSNEKNSDNLTVGSESSNNFSNEDKKSKDTFKHVELSKDELKKALVDNEGFSQSFVDGLNDEDIDKYSKIADDLRQRTGFWNKLNLFSNQIAKDYPDSSTSYPEATVTEVEEYWDYTTDDRTDMYTNVRSYMLDRGYDASSVPNGVLKEIFFKVYEDNKFASYNEHVDLATKALKEKYPNGYDGGSVGSLEENSNTPDNSSNDSKNENKSENDSKDKESSNSSQAIMKGSSDNIYKFSDNKDDYDQFRQELVKNYEFDQDKVKDISDADIDLAYYRSQERLEKEGFGDIGLVIDEIGRMYPGYSTMYPDK